MRFSLLLLAASFLAFPSLAHAAPVNDHFVDALDLDALVNDFGFARGTNVNAGKEAGEPDHAGNAGGRSVWYTWTAPGDGSIPHLAVTVVGDFDTLLAVYTGSAVNALTEAASNDDTAFGSMVSFATTPGTAYRIAVDGFAGKSGTFTIFMRESPPNDNFAEAIELTGASGSRTGDTNRGATQELGERSLGEAGDTVWYKWTPPVDGTYKLSTLGSNFDTVLSIYEGSALENLEELGSNDDDPDRGCCSSWLPIVNASSTTTYMIQVASLFGEPGDIALHWGPLILGTSQAETLVGTPGDDEIRGLGGNDVIRGFGEDDLIFGGRGNDLLIGGAGGDELADRRGDDVLRGGEGNDALRARDFRGGDVLVGGAGFDSCRGDRGDTKRTCP